MITRRIINVWRAVVGSGLTNLEVNNAESMLELEREDLRRRVGQYNLGLAGYAAISEKLKTDIKRLTHERGQLEPKLQARLTAGDRVTAGRHALRIETIDAQLAQQQAQLVETEATYGELTRAREVALVAARDRIESLKRELGDLRVQESLADLNEMAAGMQGAMGLSDGTIERLQQGIADKRNHAAGRARVARDAIDTEDARVREAEQQALAEAALARFEQKAPSPQITPAAV